MKYLSLATLAAAAALLALKRLLGLPMLRPQARPIPLPAQASKQRDPHP